MFLSFDIGNSTIACGEVSSDYGVIRAFSIEHEEEEWREELRQQMEAWPRGAVEEAEAGISSVVPAKTAALQRLLRGLGVSKTTLVKGEEVTWFTVRYDPPGSLGSDRLAGVIAARELYGYPSIVIDFGTATTVNVLDAAGDFSGGYIVPGVKTMIRSLARSTAQLPEAPLGEYRDDPGWTTEENIARGAMALTARGVEGIVARIEEKAGEAHAVIVTGGLSGAMMTGLPERFRRDGYLLLKGIRIFAGRRRGAEK